MIGPSIHFLLLTADLPKTVGRTSTGDVVLPRVAGDIVDQRAGDREADGTGCRGEGVTVHNGGNTNAAE